MSRVSVISNCASSTQCANPNGQNFLQGIEGFEYEVNKEIVFDNVTYNSQIEHGNHSLRDRQAQARILTRIGRMAAGNMGDCKAVGEGED